MWSQMLGKTAVLIHEISLLKDIEEKNHGFEKSGALQITILQ